MEGGKQSCSSLASDLFGAMDSSKTTSSSGLFNSIFAPPSKAAGRETLHSPKTDKKNKNKNDPVENEVGSEGQSKEYTLYNQDQKAPPFHYSSSIYYGGQDVYSRPPDAPNTVFTTFKDGEEDDSAGASRGNWWQGSLYY